VDFRLRCLGSIQHLKGRFGDGYQLEARAGAFLCLTSLVLVLSGGYV
jgi:hypothetical protein